MPLSPKQCRMARAALDWTQPDLSEASGVSIKTILLFERGQHVPHVNHLTSIKRALEAQGLAFTAAGGVEPAPRAF
jgi:transcriptional regulator with XRE-family HTH domain